MQKITKRIVLISTVLVATGLTACNKSSGGGVVENDEGKKITFGYQLKCEDILVSVDPEKYQAHVTGNFQYKDRNAGVSLHGKIDSFESPFDLSEFTCQGFADFANSTPVFADPDHNYIVNGTYSPQPKNAGLPGNFILGVSDQDPAGTCIEGDVLSLTLSDGVYGGYSQAGCVEKGNISIFSE